MYKQIEHQADIAVEIEAESLDKLFQDSVRALIELIAGKEETAEASVGEQGGELLRLEATGSDYEERLVGLLSELLFQAQTCRWLPQKLKRLKLDRDSVLAEIIALPGRGGEGLRREIKAVTWHNLRIVELNGAWTTRIVFDV